MAYLIDLAMILACAFALLQAKRTVNYVSALETVVGSEKVRLLQVRYLGKK